VGSNPQALVAADVNGDGKVDLISANLGVATNNNSFGPLSYGTLTVLTNNGSGISTNTATFSTGVGPTALVAIDVNGDGRPDLIALNDINYTNRSVNVTNAAASLSILFNTSNFVNTVALQTAPGNTAITYGQTLGATGLSGGVATNEAGVTVNGTFTYNTATNSVPGAGTANFAVTFAATPPTDYQPITFNVSVTVNPLTAILTGARAYDGTAVATNKILSVSNKLAGDSVTVSAGSAVLAAATIGTNSITSLGSLALGGTKAADYTLSGAGGSVIITQAVPVVALASSQNPQFNGAAVSFTATLPAYASGTIQFLTNGVNFDLETITSGSATSVATASLPVGSNTITAAYSGDANDLATATSLNQLIDPFPLPVILNGTRVYDGTTIAAYGILSVANIVGSDNVTVSAGSAGLASATVGLNAITSNNSLALGGLNAANYTLSGLSGAVVITPLPVVLNGTRAYDGTSNAVYGVLSVANNVGGDIVTVSAGSVGLAAATVGTNAIISNAAIALGGLNGGNYTPSGVSGSVIITQAVPAIVLASSQNPQFNGAGVSFTATLPADATGSIQFLTNGVNFDLETITSGSATSVATASLPVGSNTISAAYSGDANYQASSSSLNQLIDSIPLPVILNGTRVYDGTTNAAYVILSVANSIGSDDVTVSAGSVGLTTANIGTNAITSTNGLSLGGLNAANYTLSGLSGTVVITALPVVLNGTRVYDGTSVATNNILSVTNNVVGDIVTVSAGSVGLAAANVGTNAIVSNNALALGGLNASNYTPSGVSGFVIITQAVNAIALTSSQNPSGFGVGVNFTATLPSFATGTIQFLANGVNFDSEGLTAGTVGSVFTATLPIGSNTIAAAYSGDANYVPATNYLGQVVIPPQFSAPVLGSAGLVLSGSFGTPFGTYYILSSTNLALPTSQWTPLLTNQFDLNGNYNFTNPFTPAPGVYFILEMP
jgi:hypothetical protein